MSNLASRVSMQILGVLALSGIGLVGFSISKFHGDDSPSDTPSDITHHHRPRTATVRISSVNDRLTRERSRLKDFDEEFSAHRFLLSKEQKHQPLSQTLDDDTFLEDYPSTLSDADRKKLIDWLADVLLPFVAKVERSTAERVDTASSDESHARLFIPPFAESDAAMIMELSRAFASVLTDENPSIDGRNLGKFLRLFVGLIREPRMIAATAESFEGGVTRNRVRQDVFLSARQTISRDSEGNLMVHPRVAVSYGTNTSFAIGRFMHLFEFE